MRSLLLLPFFFLPSVSYAQTLTGPLAVNLQPSTAAAVTTPSYIWVTDSLAKVRQDAQNCTVSCAPGPNQGILLFAAQNEITSFQVHVQAPTGGLPSLRMSLSSMTLTSAPNTVISSVAASGAFDIQTFREIYQVGNTTKTSVGVTYFNSTGSFPDALLPTVDPYWGQTTLAWPVAVAAGQNQSAWFDIHIPTYVASGYLYGSVTVSSGLTVLANIPVAVGVWAFQMPSSATLRSTINVGFAALCAQQYGAPGTNREAGCAAYTGNGQDDLGATLVLSDLTGFMLDNRISAAYVYEPTNSNFTTLETYWGPYLNGTSNGRFKQILSGAKVNTYESTFLNYTPASSQNWGNEFQSKGWNTNSAKPFDYTCDESGCTNASFIVKASSMHAASPAVATLWTTDFSSTLGSNTTNYLDLMVPIINNMDEQSGGLQRANYNTWLSSVSYTCGSNGVQICPAHQIWSYQSCESAGTCSNGTPGPSNATWPNYNVDGVPVANRAMEWMSFSRNGASGELYYDASYCWDTFSNGACGGPFLGVGRGNPFVAIYYSGGIGDGTLIYPGVVFDGVWMTTQTVSLGAPYTISNSTPFYIPSIRLKHIRDGMQDYEYLNALSNVVGGTTTVAVATTSWITNSYTFNVTTYTTGGYAGNIESARYLLGTTLHQVNFPLIPSVTSSLAATGQVKVLFNYQITSNQVITSYSATGLPSGLSINTVTGMISGTPKAAGTTSVTLGVTNSNGTGNATLVISVMPSSSVIWTWH